MPAKEPFEVWWPKYMAKVDVSVLAAERHLEVPSGTISSIPKDPDFIATVKTYAVIEPILNEVIAAHPPHVSSALIPPSEQRANFHTFVTSLRFSGSTGKLQLVEGLGLLKDWHVSFIRAVARIRNRYAHNIKNMHRPLSELVAEELKYNQQFLAQLTGVQSELRPPTVTWEQTNSIVKFFMYHRLADYLADALHTLRPPPPLPEGSLWEGLFGLSPPRSLPH